MTLTSVQRTNAIEDWSVGAQVQFVRNVVRRSRPLNACEDEILNGERSQTSRKLNPGRIGDENQVLVDSEDRITV